MSQALEPIPIEHSGYFGGRWDVEATAYRRHTADTDRRLDELLARDWSSPNRAESALRRLGYDEAVIVEARAKATEAGVVPGTTTVTGAGGRCRCYDGEPCPCHEANTGRSRRPRGWETRDGGECCVR